MLITHVRDLPMHVKHLHHTSLFFWLNFAKRLFTGKNRNKIGCKFCFLVKYLPKFPLVFIGGDCEHNSVYCLLFKRSFYKRVANYGDMYE
jgi:hypothetical protein